MWVDDVLAIAPMPWCSHRHDIAAIQRMFLGAAGTVDATSEPPALLSPLLGRTLILCLGRCGMASAVIAVAKVR